MLSTNSWSHTLAVGSSLNLTLILELSLLGLEVSLDGLMVTVVKFAMLYTTKLGSVCFWQNLAVMDWLNGAVVVVLVNLLVDSCVDVLVYVRLHSLVLYCWGNILVHCGVMVARAASEIGEGLLNLVHFGAV